MQPLEITIPVLLAIYLLWPHNQTARPFVVRLLPANIANHFGSFWNRRVSLADDISVYSFVVGTTLAPQLGLKGPINGSRGSTIVNDYLLAFFEKALQGKSANLFDGAFPQYPEI